MMRPRSILSLALLSASLLACSDDSSSSGASPAAGGQSASAGSSQGGNAQAGQAQGGNAQAGQAQGGKAGDTAQGGKAGESAQGGKAGESAQGGQAQGGSAATGNLTVGGKVLEAATGSQASPASGVDVRASIDRNGNGAVDEGEYVDTQSGDDGTYSLKIDAADGQTVVVSFRSSGRSPAIRTVKAKGQGNATVNATLREIADLECKGGTCGSRGSVQVAGLAEGVTARGQVFNPVTEADQFPGAFADDKNNLLVSGVFSFVELTDSNGDPMHQLGEPATLRMRIPRDTWPVIRDIKPSSGAIEVPLYAFDEASGQWVADGEASLEDGDGAPIDEAKLASINDGSFTGTVVAAGKVAHFSYWNVDWPVETHGCLRGVVKNAAGAPVVGATVYVSGVTYAGSTSPQVTGSDGSFCVDVMKSEGPGEDVDQDGVTGETQQITVRIIDGADYYNVGVHDVPASQASCSANNCGDMGDVVLDEANKLTAALCTFTGTVRDVHGAPVEGVTVYGYDDLLPDGVFEQLCSAGNCTFATSSAADGTYSVTTPILTGLTVLGFGQSSEQFGTGSVQRQRMRQITLQNCPTNPVEIVLDSGSDYYTLGATLEGQTLTWEPAKPGTLLQVVNATGVSWILEGSFSPPVTYGTVPAGATQTYPESGAPAALASGDTISIYFSSVSSDGISEFGSGTVTVP